MKNKTYSLLFLAFQAISLILKGRFKELSAKFQAFQSGKRGPIEVSLLGGKSLVHVWTSPHTMFLANQIVEFFHEMGIDAEVVGSSKGKTAVPALEIVLSPTYLKFPYTRAPRIVYQLEQTTSDRWFTEQYIEYIKKSVAVFEYSEFNIPNLLSMGISLNNLFYVPLGGSSKVFDASVGKRGGDSKPRSGGVLIYGDFKGSSRRKDFLELAREKILNLKVFEENFGNSMQEELLSSKVVLNVNYYSPGILATPRLWESLSAGNSVVSEKSLNWSEYPEISKLVEFVDESEFDELIDRAREMSDAGTFDITTRRELIQSSEAHFRFMLARGLFGSGFADDDFYLSQMDISPKRDDVKIVLSLPETTERRNRAVRSLPADMIFFDGVKQVPGWIGCAKSYKLLSQLLLDQGVSRVVICEDDVVLPPSYESDMTVIYEYLDSIDNNWDVFVGLTADFDYKTTIFDVQEFRGLRFIHCNNFTSTVFNIYSRRGLEKFASWEFDNSIDHQRNTIDRFLNQDPSLRVVSLDRNMCGHNNDLGSTIWQHSNSQYESMIARSDKIRYGLMHEWLEKAR